LECSYNGRVVERSAIVSIIVVDADELMLYSSFRSLAERQRRYFAVANLFDKFFGAPLEVQWSGARPRQ